MILKEVKAFFAKRLTLTPASSLAPCLYIEAIVKSRPFTALRELRVYPYTIYEVTYRVPTKPTNTLTLTLA